MSVSSFISFLGWIDMKYSSGVFPFGKGNTTEVSGSNPYRFFYVLDFCFSSRRKVCGEVPNRSLKHRLK